MLGVRCWVLAVGWKYRDELSFLIMVHQGMIVKAVTMIVHICTQKKEGAVFRHLHEIIPLGMFILRISANTYHSRVYSRLLNMDGWQARGIRLLW